MPVAPSVTRLVKPTVHTPLHIDYEWWGRNDRELRVYLRSHLCPEHRQAFEKLDFDARIDWVDPETAEVKRIDGVQHVLATHCARQADYLTQGTSLVDAVFRVFLANDNTPLTALELGERLGRRADTILRTLSGPRVYKGLRPFLS